MATILLNPEGSSIEGVRALAARPKTLNGATIGVLGNSKLNADALLFAIGELLGERYKIKAVVHRTKPSFSLPAPQATIDEMAGACDIVLTGVGD
jgi:hypothetical protein